MDGHGYTARCQRSGKDLVGANAHAKRRQKVQCSVRTRGRQQTQIGLGAVGRAFITWGLVLLAFTAYQLWGTGLQEARAQDRLARSHCWPAAAETPARPATSPRPAPYLI